MVAGADVKNPKVWTPHRYQSTAVQFLHERTSLNPEGRGGGALFLDPGMGKSSILLEWIQQMRDYGIANRFLVIAPLRVVYNVWPDEIMGWSNFRDISFSIVHGTASVRRKRLASRVNMHLINRDAVTWLVKQLEGRQVLPWQGIIIDESTSFKNWSAKRSKALRKLIARIPYRVIMTGTPAPRNLADLYPQTWLLDEGAALGTNITRFRENYCYQVGRMEMNDYRVRDQAASTIHEKIRHMTLRLDAADYLSMPDITYHTVSIDLPSAAQADYDRMESEMFVALHDGTGREAVNAGAKYQACKQIANGGIYGEQRAIYDIHSAKTDACLEILEELGGKPALIAYQYEHDVQRLQKAIKGLHVIRGGMKPEDVTRIINAWNDDTLDPPYLAVQPQALSYGVNAQHGSCRDIIWYGPSDNLDTVLQFDCRIHRQGVGSNVRVHRLCCRGTIDEVIWKRIAAKEDVQSNLLNVLRAYAKEKMALAAA